MEQKNIKRNHKLEKRVRTLIAAHLVDIEHFKECILSNLELRKKPMNLSQRMLADDSLGFYISMLKNHSQAIQNASTFLLHSETLPF